MKTKLIILSCVVILGLVIFLVWWYKFRNSEYLTILQKQGLNFAKLTPGELEILQRPNLVQKKYVEYGSPCTLDNCPDIRGAAPTRLENAHLVMTRLLRLLDLVCRKLNIKYCCTFGTLLGAVRHQGFIPWDMDIDVLMTPEDVAILEAKGQNILKHHGIFLQTPKTDPIWQTKSSQDIIAKLRDNHSCYSGGYGFHDGFQIDIFKMTKQGGKMILSGDEIPVTEGKTLFKGQIYKHSVPFNDIYPLRTLKFEGFEVSVPNNPETVLALDYSDLNIPPVKDRIPHEPVGTYARPCSL